MSAAPHLAADTHVGRPATSDQVQRASARAIQAATLTLSRPSVYATAAIANSNTIQGRGATSSAHCCTTHTPGKRAVPAAIPKPTTSTPKASCEHIQPDIPSQSEVEFLVNISYFDRVNNTLEFLLFYGMVTALMTYHQNETHSDF